MSRPYTDADFYVAPPEPPISRRPPLTTVGPLGWLRTNLFSSPVNSAATVVMVGLVVWFLWSMITWSVRSAQWGVVYNNLRLIMSGLYDKNEIWRVELTAGILVLLTGLGLGIWGRVARSVFIAVLIILALLLLIPIIGARIPEPTIYVLVEPARTPDDLIFIGHQGDEVSFELDPITEAREANARLLGFVENRSRTEWSTQSRSATSGQLDLAAYNLNITFRLEDRGGKVISPKQGPANGVFDGPQGGTVTYTLPADGWYVLRVIRSDVGGQPGVCVVQSWRRPDVRQPGTRRRTACRRVWPYARLR